MGGRGPAPRGPCGLVSLSAELSGGPVGWEAMRVPGQAGSQKQAGSVAPDTRGGSAAGGTRACSGSPSAGRLRSCKLTFVAHSDAGRGRDPTAGGPELPTSVPWARCQAVLLGCRCSPLLLGALLGSDPQAPGRAVPCRCASHLSSRTSGGRAGGHKFQTSLHNLARPWLKKGSGYSSEPRAPSLTQRAGDQWQTSTE